MNVIHLFIENRTKWEEQIALIPHTVYQSWQYCKSIGDSLNVKVELLIVKTDDCGIALTFVRRTKNGVVYDIYSPYGYGGIYMWGNITSELYEDLKKWFNSEEIITAFLMSHPVMTQEVSFIQNYRTSFVINLTVPETDLWSKLSNGHKYEINKVKKKENWILVDNKELILNSFINLYRETVTRVDANALYNFSNNTISDLVNLNDSLLLGCEEEGELKAAILILVCGEVAEYFINASSDAGKTYSRILLWNTILEIKKRGVKQFNIGGGIKEGDSLEDFKRRMGGETKMIKVFKEIVNNEKYNSLCGLLDVNLKDDSYFPPYWKK